MKKARLDAFLRRTKDEDAKADAIKRSEEAVRKVQKKSSRFIYSQIRYGTSCQVN